MITILVIFVVGVAGYLLSQIFLSSSASRQIPREFKIAGISFRGLTEKDEGEYEGTVRCDYGNKYDPYALAVYTSKGKHVGFIPKGNEALFKKVNQAGGKIPCRIEINVDYEGDDDGERTIIYGKVYLD